MFRWLIVRYSLWRDHDPGNQEYPQTWFFVPHWRPMRRLVQFLCGVLVGHALSETEQGIGVHEENGQLVPDLFADVHCRWCDRVFKVPLEELPQVVDLLPLLGQEMPEDKEYYG